MSIHPRLSKVTESWQKCQEPFCGRNMAHFGGLYYGDNDTIYCSQHVISHVDPWRITKCTHCDCPDDQTGTDCKECGDAL